MAETPYQGSDIVAAYKAVYGSLPAGMMDKQGNLLPAFQDAIYPGTVLKTPSGQSIDSSQLMYMYQQSKGTGNSPAPAAQPTPGATQSGSYLAAPVINGVNYSTGPSSTAASGGNNMADGISMGGVDPATAQAFFAQQRAAAGLPAGAVDDATAIAFYNQANPPPAPETVALGQMAGIDPNTEALRNQLSGSYLTGLQQGQAPTAAQFQSYLDLYKQIDPSGAAARQALGDQISSNLALGSQLDPQTAREVEQGTRAGQAARGNVYGTPQMVQEAMTRGQAGLALQNQRQQAALSYLQSGQTMGDVGMNLYNTQQQNLRANQGAALGYLGSGQTPFQAGTSYLNAAEADAANAAQGGPVYNPASLGASYGGSASQFPQYGLDIGQQSQNWYNSLSAYTGMGGTTQKNPGVSAATGALSGAASGATAGSAAGPYGTIIGGAVGAIGGGLSGYYS